VISGSGVRAPGSGPRALTRRIASVDRATAPVDLAKGWHRGLD